MANPSTNTRRLTTLILWAIAWAAAMIASAILLKGNPNQGLGSGGSLRWSHDLLGMAIATGL